MDPLTKALTTIGVWTILIIISLILVSIFQLVMNMFIKIRQINTFNKRDDYPPTAKCYCIDCEYWKDGYCDKHTTFIKTKKSATWFCADSKVRIN